MSEPLDQAVISVLAMYLMSSGPIRAYFWISAAIHSYLPRYPLESFLSISPAVHSRPDVVLRMLG